MGKLVDMPRTYECPTHKTIQKTTNYCEKCIEDFRNRKPVSEMTIEERATILETMHTITTMPFSDIRQRIDELVGRKVIGYELGLGLEKLADEVRSQRTPTLDNIPEGIQVIIVEI